MAPLASGEPGRPVVSRIFTPCSITPDAYANMEKRVKSQEAIIETCDVQVQEMNEPVSPENVYHGKGTYSVFPPTPVQQLGRSGTGSTTMSRVRTDPITQRLIEHRATQAARWTIHWRSPVMMITSFLVGVLLAIGQHLLYASLHHKVEENEDEKIKLVLYGRALAYFSKVAFGMCCILVYRQRIWTTFRRQALSVTTIDQLFLATEEPSIFFNWEAIRLAPLATSMAFFIWLIPVATIIFSPGALTFGWYFEIDNVQLMVPTLNFSAESYSDWRTPTKLPDGATRKSFMYYNTTDNDGKKPGFFDYYDEPSSDITRVTLMTAFSQTDSFLSQPDARQNSCGGAFNCTFTTSFLAPAYKCDQVASSSADDAELTKLGAPFNTSALVPEGRNVYFAEVDQGRYRRPQNRNITARGGVPPEGMNIFNLGAFRTEPILWIGYALNTSERLPLDSPYAMNWTHRFEQHIFRCVHHETRYTVKWNYTEPFFSTDVKQEFLDPIINTSFSLHSDGTPNWDIPIPTQNYIRPTDVQRYKKVAAYHVMGQSLRTFLGGSIEMDPPIPGPSYPRMQSKIAQTMLVSNSTSLPSEEFIPQLQAFYTNMVLSVHSAPQMLVVSEEPVMVNRTRFQSTFIYSPEKLWACYAPVILITLMILLIGAWSIIKDGTTFSVGFSRIMVTTRNNTLDEISRGACLGNDPFPDELMQTRLKFGVLDDNKDEYFGVEAIPGVGHCAFGVSSEVSPIHKGMPYAGLRANRAKKQKVE